MGKACSETSRPKAELIPTVLRRHGAGEHELLRYRVLVTSDVHKRLRMRPAAQRVILHPRSSGRRTSGRRSCDVATRSVESYSFSQGGKKKKEAMTKTHIFRCVLWGWLCQLSFLVSSFATDLVRRSRPPCWPGPASDLEHAGGAALLCAPGPGTLILSPVDKPAMVAL